MEELNLIKDFGTPAGMVAFAIYLVGRDIVKAIKAQKQGDGEEAYKINTIHSIVSKSDEKGRLLVYGSADEKLDRMIEILYENGQTLKEISND